MRRALLVTLGALACTVLTACEVDDQSSPGSPDEFVLPAMPSPTEFTSNIEHPFLPLRPGARWIYVNRTDEGVERIVVTVLKVPRVVAGVTATVVHDRATVDGVLTENTYDWYAQDETGNVWYLGEDTTAFEEGKPPDKEGSWEAGVDGAKPGIAMPGRPRVGDRYQQEYFRGTAEDRGEVLTLDASGSVPWGDFTGAIRTRDTTPLEPDLVEYKYYVRDVGTVLEEEGEERLELISFRPGR